MESATVVPLSPEWVDARKRMVTASDMAAACGLNPFCSRNKLFDMKMGFSVLEENEYMIYGRLHEPGAINEYETITGSLVAKARFYTSEVYEGMGCTPDGLVGDPGLLEAKCPQLLYPTIPVYYFSQMIGQLALTNRTWCDFVAWTPEVTGIWHVEWSQPAWEWMLPYLKEFLGYMRERAPPPRFKRRPDGREFVELIKEERIF